jgi:hypothetical protein
MIAFPGMLVSAAVRAGIKVPDDPDKFNEVRDQYPHFYVFCVTQLARAMDMGGEHWDNAYIIASIPDDEIMKQSLLDLIISILS